MKTQNWTLLLILAALTFPGQAHAGADPELSLSVEQDSGILAYTSAGGSDCLVLAADGGFGDADLPGLKRIISDIEVVAGPGVIPEAAPEGSLPYTYALLPELRGNKLIYKGLLATGHANGAQAKARAGQALSVVINQDLPGKKRVSLIYTQSCE